MFKHILIPLDGSQLAEASLSAAAYLSKHGASEVTLVHIIEGRAPSEIHGERHLTTKEEADDYLRSTAERFFGSEIKVNYHVHDIPVSGVARSIADHQEEFDHDLIVMCTHGRSGPNTLVFGSIAQKLVSLGTVPVLIVHPSSQKVAPEILTLSPFLVPLDGTPEHEKSVSVAGEFAIETQSVVHLLMVVPTLRTLPGKWEDSTKLLPTSADRMLEMAAEEAEEYLENECREFERLGLTVSAELRRGDPATVICESVVERQARLLVLGTHGKSGMSAIWEGSIASRVLSRINVPVLLVPVSHLEP